MREPRTSVIHNSTLLQANGRILAAILGVGGFALLTALGAHIRIPLVPVPITLQTLFVLLSGAVIGPRYGSLSQSLYVGLGITGVPLFAGATTGLAVLSGPTGGYLLGFVLAPFIVGGLIQRRSGFVWRGLVFTIGTLVILALGVIHLTLFYTHHLGQALVVGLLPFLVGDAFKLLAATSIYGSFRLLRRSR